MYFIFIFLISFNFISAEISLEHSKFTHDYLKKDKQLIFFGNPKENLKKSYFLFRCENEKTPYDFMQMDPLYKYEIIEDFVIEELELTNRDEKTELMKHLKQTKDLSV